MAAPLHTRETHSLYVKAAPGLKLRDKKVERLARKVRTVCAWLEPSDYPMVRAWSELEVLVGYVYAVLRASGPINAATGEARRLLNEYRLLRQTQAGLAAQLGLTPLARIAIKASGASAALDLADITEPVSERVIEVGTARGKVNATGATAEVADGAAKPGPG